MTHIQIFLLDKGRVGNDCYLNELIERSVDHKPCYGIRSGLSIARGGLERAPYPRNSNR